MSISAIIFAGATLIAGAETNVNKAEWVAPVCSADVVLPQKAMDICEDPSKLKLTKTGKVSKGGANAWFWVLRAQIEAGKIK